MIKYLANFYFLKPLHKSSGKYLPFKCRKSKRFSIYYSNIHLYHGLIYNQDPGVDLLTFQYRVGSFFWAMFHFKAVKRAFFPLTCYRHMKTRDRCLSLTLSLCSLRNTCPPHKTKKPSLPLCRPVRPHRDDQATYHHLRKTGTKHHMCKIVLKLQYLN